MGNPPQPQRSPQVRLGRDDYSLLIWQHIGWVRVLATKWSNRWLTSWERDEIINAALLEGSRLLARKYDPARGSVTTFLSRFLYARTAYRLAVDKGYKSKPPPVGWIEETRIAPLARQRELDPAKIAEFEDLIQAADPSIQPIYRRLSQGEPLKRVLKEEGNTLGFDTRSSEERDFLHALLRVDLQRLLDDH